MHMSQKYQSENFLRDSYHFAFTVLPLNGSFYTGSRFGDWTFPFMLYKSNIVHIQLAAFSRTGAFERRFHLVFGKITSVCK